jgi:hypothetical protein
MNGNPKPHHRPTSNLPWVRVFKYDGTHEDVQPKLGDSEGKRLKFFMFSYYNKPETRAVVALSSDKKKMINHMKKGVKHRDSA